MRSKRRRTSQTKGDTEECCALCRLSTDDPAKFGEMFTLKQHKLTVHYFCLLTSSGVYQRGEEDEGVLGFLVDDIKQEIYRSNRLTCGVCKRRGASVGCFVRSCRKKVHFPCGKKQQFIFQFTDVFQSYCKDHSPSQSVSVSLDLSLPHSCSICLDTIEPVLSYSVLKCPACHASWFHRDCVQHQAHSAGLFFFRCTLCNNKDSFQQEMLRMGIHIPERDASWELEENAFEELLEVYQRCDALDCLCISGRAHSAKTGWFEVLRCALCGSKGTHRRCSDLTLDSTNWACEDCTDPVDGKASLVHRSSPQSGGQRRSLLSKRCLSSLHSAISCKRPSLSGDLSPEEILQALALQLISPQNQTQSYPSPQATIQTQNQPQSYPSPQATIQTQNQTQSYPSPQATIQNQPQSSPSPQATIQPQPQSSPSPQATIQTQNQPQSSPSPQATIQPQIQTQSQNQNQTQTQMFSPQQQLSQQSNQLILFQHLQILSPQSPSQPQPSSQSPSQPQPSSQSPSQPQPSSQSPSQPQSSSQSPSQPQSSQSPSQPQSHSQRQAVSNPPRLRKRIPSVLHQSLISSYFQPPPQPLPPLPQAQTPSLQSPPLSPQPGSQADSAQLQAPPQTRFYPLFQPLHISQPHTVSFQLQSLRQSRPPPQSPSPQPNNTPQPHPAPLLQPQALSSPVEVTGDRALSAGLALVKRSDFNPTHRLSVRFKDGQTPMFPSCPGGVTAKCYFLKLLVEQIQESVLFEGPPGAKNLVLDSQALREDLYFEVGCLLAVSLVHGGPPLCFFSPALYQCLFNFPRDTPLTVTHVAHSHFAQRISRIAEARSLEDLKETMEACRECLELAGCNRPISKLEDKHALVEDLVSFTMITRMQLPLQRFREGLKTLGVFELVQIFPALFCRLFCGPAERLTAETLADLFTVHFSDQRDRQDRETPVVTFWRRLLVECDVGRSSISLQDILLFSTGADAVPALGFRPPPSLTFIHPQSPAEETGRRRAGGRDGDHSSEKRRGGLSSRGRKASPPAEEGERDDGVMDGWTERRLFPQSQPGSNRLSLPVVSCYLAFKSSMERAISLGNRPAEEDADLRV